MQKSFSKILAFFLLIFGCCVCSVFVGCVQPLANSNVAYPKIVYEEGKNTDIVPSDFAKTFINRFKILYEKTPNVHLKALYFHFSDYRNEALEETLYTRSFSLMPDYHITLHIDAVMTTGTQKFVEGYTIPTMGFNPPYSQNFDGLILRILRNNNNAESLH